MMPRLCSRRSAWFLSAVVVACAIGAVMGQTAPASAVTISGRVLGGDGMHTIYVALWDEKGFLRHPVQQIAIGPRNPPNFRFIVAPGGWAVSAFEDENGNHILDMGMFGPKEPSGFWHSFHAWRKPRFGDVAASIVSDTPDADIQLGR